MKYVYKNSILESDTPIYYNKVALPLAPEPTKRYFLFDGNVYENLGDLSRNVNYPKETIKTPNYCVRSGSTLVTVTSIMVCEGKKFNGYFWEPYDVRERFVDVTDPRIILLKEVPINGFFKYKNELWLKKEDSIVCKNEGIKGHPEINIDGYSLYLDRKIKYNGFWQVWSPDTFETMGSWFDTHETFWDSELSHPPQSFELTHIGGTFYIEDYKFKKISPTEYSRSY